MNQGKIKLNVITICFYVIKLMQFCEIFKSIEEDITLLYLKNIFLLKL